MTKTIHFESTASRPKSAVALIYDLEGFSAFFNQPDVQEYVPKFLNRVSAALSVIIYGGLDYWTGEPETNAALRPPVHEKFLGDGALYLWTETREEPFDDGFIIPLANTLWNLKTNFHKIVEKCYDDLPVADLPKRIRFGLTRGTVYELRRKGTRQLEYIGFCINLASRLQKYCPGLGFTGSAFRRARSRRMDTSAWSPRRSVASHVRS
jgi:class 3 adenylate cyclase